MNNIINYSSDVARLLTKGYGSISEPIYVDNNGQIQIATNVQAGGGTNQGLIKKTVDLSALNTDTYYPVVSDSLPGRGFNHIKLAVHLDSGTVPAWSTHANGFSVVVEVLATSAGWGTIPELSIILQDNYAFTATNPASYQQLHNSSRAVFYLRGGGIYFLYADWDATWTIYTESTTFSNETVAPTTTRPAHSILRSNIWANLYGTATNLYDRTNNTATYLNYGAAGLAGSAISWMACWNGYELRAISKAETFNLVRDNGGDSRWVTLTTEQTISGVKHFTGNLWWGSSNGGGYLNGAATNGGINSIRIGDDVWLGDCNTGGIMGMKSTGANCGFYFYNSSGTQIGQLFSTNSSQIYSNYQFRSAAADSFRSSYGNYGVIMRNDGSNFYFLVTASGSAATGSWNSLRPFYFNLTNAYVYGTRFYSAVWNDFAEFRQSDVKEPGRVLVSNGKGQLILATERLQKTGHIISDTFGLSVGESDTAKTPIGVGGRVLVYPYQDRHHYKVGDCVCTAPNGTADIMTDEEVRLYPDRIIGIVDEIPNYEIWEQVNNPSNCENTPGGAHKVSIPVNGRIWVYAR